MISHSVEGLPNITSIFPVISTSHPLQLFIAQLQCLPCLMLQPICLADIKARLFSSRQESIMVCSTLEFLL
jgi:hypothetical protein